MIIDVQKVRSPILAKALGKLLVREFKGSRRNHEAQVRLIRETVRRRNEIMPLLRVGRAVKDAWPQVAVTLRLNFDPTINASLRWGTIDRGEEDGRQSIFEMKLAHPIERHRQSFFRKVQAVAKEQDCLTSFPRGYDTAESEIAVRPKWHLGRRG